MSKENIRLECECDMWKKNLPMLLAPFMIEHQHFQYTGDMFIYCPWCSKKLIEFEGV